MSKCGKRYNIAYNFFKIVYFSEIPTANESLRSEHSKTCTVLCLNFLVHPLWKIEKNICLYFLPQTSAA